MEAVEQWHIGRRLSWPERYQPLPHTVHTIVVAESGWLPGLIHVLVSQNEAADGCREEILADGGESSGEEAEMEQAQPWSAFAETCIPRASGAGPPLWADSQFHILEMQTSSCQGLQDHRQRYFIANLTRLVQLVLNALIVNGSA